MEHAVDLHLSVVRKRIYIVCESGLS